MTPNAIVNLAKRAPSAHNTQPARWWVNDACVVLLEDPERKLFVGDPNGVDQRVALGAAWENTRLAFIGSGKHLGEVRFEDFPEHDAGAFIAVAWAPIQEGEREDILAKFIDERVSFRGVFQREKGEGLVLDNNEYGLKAVVKDDEQTRKSVAAAVERANRAFMFDAPYYEEFYSWLRFKKSHPLYDQDGLNREALALPASLAGLANALMRPSVFNILKRIGVGAQLVSESKEVLSSHALVALYTDKNTSDFDVGRGFLRQWLHITQQGQALCPMSALADHEEIAPEMRNLFGIDDSQKLVNVWRCGIAPKQNLSSRLDTNTLLVNA